jgi:hypothetical protein
MITYEQIQAIHEAMRECEINAPATYSDRDGYECMTFEALEVYDCFAKIRAALAGDAFERTTPGVSLYEAGRVAFKGAGFIPPPLGDSGGINMTIPESTIDMGPGPIVEIDCERMVRPEDVAPVVTERTDEDSKITWQG